jgi:hypothetical protein
MSSNDEPLSLLKVKTYISLSQVSTSLNTSELYINDCLAASGDIRNVVLTVNGLPEDYTGQLDITINDITPFVTIRNILLLSLLGKIPNTRKAADVALHVWYSAFVPPEYHLLLAQQGVELMDSRKPDGTFSMTLGPKLGSRVTMDGTMIQDHVEILGMLITSKYTVAKVNEAMHNVQYV